MEIIEGGNYDICEHMEWLRSKDLVFDEIVYIIKMKLDEKRKRKKWYDYNVNIYIPLFPLTFEQKNTLEMYLDEIYSSCFGKHLVMKKCKFSKRYKISSKK